jgi:hypothetical protein
VSGRSLLASFVLVACAREPAPVDDGTTSGSTTDIGSTGSTSTDATTESSGSSSGVAESSTSSGDGSSTTAEPCTPADECREASDCPLPGATCRACTCVGGIGCVKWGEGAWGVCLVDGMGDASACESAGAQCLPDGQAEPMGATCVFPGCDEPCDCPQPPRGFEAQVACGDVANNGGDVLECYVSCERGQPCPRRWSCANELYCVRPGVETLDPWSPCTVADLCPPSDSGEEGICFDLVMGSVCSTVGCADAADCGDAPATGMAPPQCADITGDMVPECILDCSDGRACPDEMVCEGDTLCVWP